MTSPFEILARDTNSAARTILLGVPALLGVDSMATLGDIALQSHLKVGRSYPLALFWINAGSML